MAFRCMPILNFVGLKGNPFLPILNGAQRRTAGYFEPSYLDWKPEIDEYPEVNFRMKSMDFAVLESYSRYVHRAAKTLGYKCDSIPIPTRSKDAIYYAPRSTTERERQSIPTYTRVVRLFDVPCKDVVNIVRLVHCNQPTGVSLTVTEHDKGEEDFRYVPQTEFDGVKKAIDDIIAQIRKP